MEGSFFYWGILKSIPVSLGDFFCQTIDIGQAEATPEGTLADVGDTIGDGDGFQAAAFIERIVTDVGYAVG